MRTIQPETRRRIRLTRASRVAFVLSVVSVASLTPFLATRTPAEASFPGPNGLITYVTDGDIYIAHPAAGKGIIQLTSGPANDHNPAWSADGRFIAFGSNRSGGAQIFTMRADGSGITQVTSLAAGARDPAWSPDGSKLAFASGHAIHVMNPNGTEITNLTGTPDDSSYIDPVWSPDGSSIAFAGDGCAEPRDIDGIYTIDADGENQQALFEEDYGECTAANPFYHSIDWSPDGARLAYTERDSEGNFLQFLDVADPSGPDPTRPQGRYDPAWSPDGTRLAFHDNGINGLGGIGHSDVDDPDAPPVVVAPRGNFPDWGTGHCIAGGSAGDDVLVGTTDDEVFCAGGGNDIIRPGGGRDIVFAGPGSDTIDYSNAGESVQIDLTSGRVTGAANALLADVENAIGSAHNDRITGTNGSNYLEALAGNDVIVPRAGNDHVNGGTGNSDRVEFTTSTNRVKVDLGAGTATGQGADSLTAIESAYGSAFRDSLRGSRRANSLMGLGRVDTIVGLAGHDRLFGGFGNDSLDSQDSVAGNDKVDGGPGTDTCTVDTGDAVTSCP